MWRRRGTSRCFETSGWVRVMLGVGMLLSAAIPAGAATTNLITDPHFESGVAPLEGRFPRHLAGQEYAGGYLPEPVAQGEPPPRSAKKALFIGNADRYTLPRILHPVAPGEQPRMGKELLAAAVAQEGPIELDLDALREARGDVRPQLVVVGGKQRRPVENTGHAASLLSWHSPRRSASKGG